MMKLSRRFGALLLVAAAASLAGCSQRNGGGGDQPGAVGKLALPLTTQGASGVTYRLRDATFNITGYSYGVGGSGWGGTGGSSTTVTVSSETDPDAATISVSLEEGQYVVELLPGWHLEKLTSEGAEAVEATLLSSNPQWVWVNRQWTSFAEFGFGLGSREVWLNGELNLGVVVYEDPSEIYGGGGSGGGFPGGTGGAGGFSVAGGGGAAAATSGGSGMVP